MKTTASNPITVGKYLISPLTKALEGGWFACSVSIRSGSGSATTDRVVRLTRLFRTASEAAKYAIQEGFQWIGRGAQPRMAYGRQPTDNPLRRVFS